MEMLLDTNILVRAYNKSSPYQKGASAVIKNAMQGETEAYSISQVLYESFAIVTNPRRVERSMLLDEAAGLCIDLWECREIEKVDTTPLAPGEVFKLVKELKLSKGRVSDCV